MMFIYFFQLQKSIEADKTKEKKKQEAEIFEWLTVEIILINGK